MDEPRNLTLVMDFYELTMSQCYFNQNKDLEVVFDLFYRKIRMTEVFACWPDSNKSWNT